VLLIFKTQYAEIATKVKYAAELNRVPTSCKIAALGDAGVALPLDASSSFYNPSSHAFIKNYELSLEYAKLYGGMSSHWCGVFHIPLPEQMNINVLFTRFESGRIIQWDTLPQTELARLMDASLRPDSSYIGTFENNQNLLTFSIAKVFALPIPRPAEYSYPLPIDLAVGLNFKGYWQTMNPGSSLRMGMNVNSDAGIMLRIATDYDLIKKQVCREIYAGIGVKDFLRTNVIWLHSPDNYQETVDMTEYIGASYIDKTHFLGMNWIVSFAVQKYYNLTYHAGIEAQIADIFSIRLGLSDKSFTCGAGISYKSYALDYAFRFDELENSPMRIALKIGF